MKTCGGSTWCAVSASVALSLGLMLGGCRTDFPGESFSGELPAATPQQAALAAELRGHVEELAGKIGVRSAADAAQLQAAERYVTTALERMGYEVKRQTFMCDARDATGARVKVEVANLEVELKGTSKADEIVVIGAHYDSVHDGSRVSPGADGNASGTAGVLALAKRLAEKRHAGSEQARTIRFVLFANGEPPYFWTEEMGSRVYANGCKARKEKIVAMLSVEMIGCYTAEQMRPPFMDLVYPKAGNFIAFVGMPNARPLISECVGVFREKAAFPCEGAALTWMVPRTGSGDHWSFWINGYAAAMVTDTGRFRNPNYLGAGDVPETLDYDRMARVITGMEPVIQALCDTERELRGPDAPEG